MSIVFLPQYIHSMHLSAPNPTRREQLEAVAEQFEAVFLQQILKQMRKANEALNPDSSMRGRELALMHDLHDQAVAEALARRRQGGIAKLLVQQLGGRAEAEDRAAQAQANGAVAGPALQALVESVIKHESAGDPSAVSPKGARGLMQLMPATAREMARELGLEYDEQRLTSDPAYNRRLGTAYLDKLLRRYDGHVALALAAYNAGPARVDRWLERFGDPRRNEIDTTEWVERIPYAETRAYTRRVLTELAQAAEVWGDLAAVRPRLPLTADGQPRPAVRSLFNGTDSTVALQTRAPSASTHMSAAFAQPLRVGKEGEPS